MKRFLTAVIGASAFFLGVGALVDQAGARFKSDEKALELIRKARAAIGGDSEAAGIQSMIIKGRTTQTFKVDGSTKTEQGETEIALQLPDKLMRTVKMGDGNAAGGHQLIDKQIDVVVVSPTKDGHVALGKGEGKGTGIGTEPGTRVIVRSDDGTVKEFKGAEADKVIVRDGSGATSTWTTKDGQTVNVDGKHVIMERAGSAEAHHTALKHNELLRLTLGLLLTAPQGMDVDYAYAGEADLDGIGCNVVVASFGGQAFKLFLDRSSNLPVGMTFTAPGMPKVVHFEKELAPGKDGGDRTMIRKVDASKTMAEYNVRFSDYRAVNGVQLPFKWTQTIGGQPDETFDVTSYEVNPPNIGEKFKGDHNVMIRKKAGN